jgi:ribonuclease D
MTRFIDTADALSALRTELLGTAWLAVDCEFIRDESYFPELCLVQVATAREVVCIDPSAVTDLGAFAEVLFDARTTKVFHAGRQDLEVFYHVFGRVPGPVFDTQIAAPLLGLPEQIGYADLVRQLLGILLSKSQARTDWRRRPLSSAQLNYAADDVRYLATLYPQMRERLRELGRLDWLAADFEALTAPELYANEPDQAWMRIKIARQLDGLALGTLRAVAAWRESTAREANRPRGWILRDEAMCDIARARPRSLAELAGLRAIGEATVRRHGAALLSAVAGATPVAAIAPDARVRNRGLTVEEEILVDLMAALVRARAAAAELNHNLVASRRDLERFVLTPDADHALRSGWRRQLVGEALDALRLAQVRLCYEAGNLRLEPLDAATRQS